MGEIVNGKIKNIKLCVFLLVLILGIVVVLNLLLNFSGEEIKRVWLLENGQNTPYFILEEKDNNYLLIREHVLESHEFVYPDAEDSYYANSALDDFLNEEFINYFSEDMKKYFIESNVEITTKESIGCCGGETEYIQRVFFVPSWTEATGMHNSVSLEEGRYLKKLEKVRAATNDNGEIAYYWLRTPNTWNFNRVLGIAESGGVFTGSTVDSLEVYKAGVRPMCRINANAPIIFED